MNINATAADLRALSRLLDVGLEQRSGSLEAWLGSLANEDRQHVPRLRDLLTHHFSGSPSAFMAAGPKLDHTRDEPAVKPGEWAGPYRLVREAGRGGMSVVWLASRLEDGAPVAVKLPRGVPVADTSERIERERVISALMQHAQIATLIDSGIDAAQRPYLVFDYIDGKPLDAWCKHERLDVNARLRLFLQVAHAVAYVHGRGVVHRDLKPSNVLVTDAGQAHVIDFGIATLAGRSADTQAATTALRSHTPGYASPEQRQGGATTFASDVYSLGVMLFELLTGELPHGHWQQSKQLSGPLCAILRTALADAPERRFATADAFADQVEDCLRHSDTGFIGSDERCSTFEAGKPQ